MPEYLVTICAFADAMVAKRVTVANANFSMSILPVTCFIFLFINDVRGQRTRLSNVPRLRGNQCATRPDTAAMAHRKLFHVTDATDDTKDAIHCHRNVGMAAILVDTENP